MFLVIGNILLIIGMLFTDYESDFWIFNVVDPLFLGWYWWNMMFIMYSATRSRFSRVSYTAISSNMHCGITDQYSTDINFRADSPGDGSAMEDEEEPTIYDTAATYVKGTSFPRLSNKRTILIGPKSLVDSWLGYVMFKCQLGRYVGQDQKSLPPHITEELQRMDKRRVRFRFGGTTVWYGTSADKWVAHWQKEAFKAPDNNKYNWLVGGKTSIPYSQADEESKNRRIHDLRAQREELERQYERITGKPYVDDKEDE